MLLRKFVPADAEEIIKWIKNERELRLWSADRYDEYPITSNDINNNYIECAKNTNFYPSTLVNNNKIIGHLIIRRKGYGKRLILETINYAQKEYGAEKFNLGVFIDNDNALNCYKAAGFEVVQIEKNAFKFYNENWDCAKMIYKNY